jgi:hypothetical protein
VFGSTLAAHGSLVGSPVPSRSDEGSTLWIDDVWEISYDSSEANMVISSKPMSGRLMPGMAIFQD